MNVVQRSDSMSSSSSFERDGSQRSQKKRIQYECKEAWAEPQSASPMPLADDEALDLGFENNVSEMTNGFTNIGFQDSLDKDSFQKLDLASTYESTQRRLEEWQGMARVINTNRTQVKQQLQERRTALVQMVDDTMASLEEKLEQTLVSDEDFAHGMVASLSTVLDHLDVERANLEQHGEVQNTEALSRRCGSAMTLLQTKVTQWRDVELQTNTNTAAFLISQAFGNIRGQNVQAHTVKLRPKPPILTEFKTRSSHNAMTIGITDMVFGPNGYIYMCDKSNKHIKAFDKKGALQFVIAKPHVREPVRLTVWTHNENKLVVTDHGVRVVKLFTLDGRFLTDFITGLKQPAGLAETHTGELVVVEFESQNAFLYSINGSQLSKIRLDTPCPAHVTCTPDGSIVVSDWRNHLLHTYDVGGNCLNRYHGNGKELNQPHGMCIDSYGHFLVADYKNSRIQIMNMEGKVLSTVEYKSVKEMHQLNKGLYLPVTLATETDGTVIVAEYLGGVKIFKYLDIVSNEDTEDGFVAPRDVCLTPRDVTNGFRFDAHRPSLDHKVSDTASLNSEESNF